MHIPEGPKFDSFAQLARSMGVSGILFNQNSTAIIELYCKVIANFCDQVSDNVTLLIQDSRLEIAKSIIRM